MARTGCIAAADIHLLTSREDPLPTVAHRSDSPPALSNHRLRRKRRRPRPVGATTRRRVHAVPARRRLRDGPSNAAPSPCRRPRPANRRAALSAASSDACSTSTRYSTVLPVPASPTPLLARNLRRRPKLQLRPLPGPARLALRSSPRPYAGIRDHRPAGRRLIRRQRAHRGVIPPRDAGRRRHAGSAWNRTGPALRLGVRAMAAGPRTLATLRMALDRRSRRPAPSPASSPPSPDALGRDEPGSTSWPSPTAAPSTPTAAPPLAQPPGLLQTKRRPAPAPRTRVFEGRSPPPRRHLAERNLILNASAVLWRRADLLAALRRCEGELAALRVAGDWRVYAEMLAREGARVAYVARPLNHHRRHDGSVTARQGSAAHVAEIARVHAAVARLIGPGAGLAAAAAGVPPWVGEALGVAAVLPLPAPDGRLTYGARHSRSRF